MTGCCPVCGSLVISADLVLLRDRHIVCRGDQLVRLSNREWAMFERLLQSAGKPVSKAVLQDWIYGLENDAPWAKIIDVFAMKLRQKLKPLDIEIKTHWGFGLSLEYKGRSRIVTEAEAA